MRFAMIRRGGKNGLALLDNRGDLRAAFAGEPSYPGSLDSLIASGTEALEAAGQTLREAATVDPDTLTFLPPLMGSRKIICVGLNYVEHAKEAGNRPPPEHPVIFARFTSSLIGHQAPIVRPNVSQDLDYEGEMVAVIGVGGRELSKDKALDHVIGYSVFNDASIRDYQLRTPQWTVGKNFDGTGAFGPYFVTADELSRGAKGLRLQTRLNGRVVQAANTNDMVFDIQTLVSQMSAAFTLEPGDLIVSGTPGGVGMAHKPPLWMKPGDVCEVEIEGIGVLKNPVVQQSST